MTDDSLRLWRLPQQVGALLVFCGCFYLNQSLANIQHKSMLMFALAQNRDVDAFFQIPVLFYGFLQSVGVPLFAFSAISGALITLALFRKPVSFGVFLVKLFIMVPAFMLYLGLPSKEFFLILFMMLAAQLWRRGKPFNAMLVELVYTVGFRIYFLPFTFAKFISRFIPASAMYMGLILVPIILCYAPIISDFVADLMLRRDVAHLEHRGVIRSGFLNPLNLSGNDSIFLNYLYALARLNLPILFYFGPKELFLQLYIIVLVGVFLTSRICPPSLKAAVIIHMFVLATFEPDLGSYLRHLSSLFPWAFVILEGRAYASGGLTLGRNMRDSQRKYLIRV